MTKMITLAGCVIRNTEGKILVIHRNTPKRVQWETPGGKIEEGENPNQAAERELQEELGVKVEIIKKLGEKEFHEDDFTMHYTWFLARVISGTPKLIEPEKFDDMEHFSWEELTNIKDQLSANTKNLVDEYFAGNIQI